MDNLIRLLNHYDYERKGQSYFIILTTRLNRDCTGRLHSTVKTHTGTCQVKMVVGFSSFSVITWLCNNNNNNNNSNFTQINFPRFCRWKHFLQFFFFSITLETKQTSLIFYFALFWKTRESQTAKIKIIINGVINRSHIKNGCKNFLP